MEAIQSDDKINLQQVVEEEQMANVQNEEASVEESTVASDSTKKSSKKKKRRRRKKKGLGAVTELPLDGCNNFPIKLVQDQIRGRHIVATRDIEPGEVVCESMCYGASMTVSDTWRESACHRCLHIVSESIIRCGGCNVAHYCSERCRRTDAPLHQAECGALKPLLDGMPMEEDSITLRLAARIAALASKDTECGNPMSSTRPRYEHIAGLEDHVEKIDATVREELTKASNTIASSLGAHFDVTPERVLHLLLATQSNAHGVRIAHAHPLLALGLFPMGSMLNHSCLPNCHHHFVLKRHQFPILQFRATCQIAQGAELCYAYTDLYQSTEARRAALRTAYSFECDCLRCIRATEPEENETLEESEESLDKVSYSLIDAMISGAVCPNIETCNGVMRIKADVAECHKCGNTEPLETYQKRLKEAEARVSTIANVAAAMLQGVPTEGRQAALAAREQCMAALSGIRTLHPHHHLILKTNLLLTQACEVALSEGAKENADSEANTNDSAQANAERLSILIDKVTAHAAAFKAMDTCIGGNQPEIASQLFDLGQTLSEIGFNKIIIPQEKMPDVPEVTIDWGDPHAMLGSATQLLQRAQKVYGLCLGEDHSDTQKVGSALKFIFQMVDQLFKPTKTTGSAQNGKKKRKNKKKK